eukprot:67048_1
MNMQEPDINAAWDNDDEDDDAVSYDGDDIKQQFMSKIDADIDFDERYEVVGCCELSSKSPAFGRFKFMYFFLCLAEQFGFYWITLIGTFKYGYSQWLDRYIMSLMIGGFISEFMSSLMGRLSDRFGRKFIILLSILIQSFPYIPLCIFPDELDYFLYILPCIGLCGSIATLTGVMKAYVVDCLPKSFLVSAFAKLIAIYGGAGILSSLAISAIIGGELRDFFTTQITLEFTTQMIMYITVGLYAFTFLMFVIFVPESLPKDRRAQYANANPCHGIRTALSNGVIMSTALFLFFCTYSMFGMISVVRDIFLIDFDYQIGHFDLLTVSEYEGLNTAQASSPADIDRDAILSDDVVVYGAFMLSLGCTLICARCCVKWCFCGKAITNLICSMLILMISYGIIVYLLLAPDVWWVFIVSLICGIFFAFGEIGFAFLNAVIAKYMNSKQYGIAYGLLHSVYSLAKAAAPYTFFIVFEMLTKPEYTPHELGFGKAKSVVYVAIILILIGTLIAVCGLKKSMAKYEENRGDVRIDQGKGKAGPGYDYASNGARFGDEGGEDHPQALAVIPSGAAVQGNDVEMQPPPDPQYGLGFGASGRGSQIDNVSVVSSNYVVGQPAPQYANQPYVARVSVHQPQWSLAQQQQQQQPQGGIPSYEDLPSGSFRSPHQVANPYPFVQQPLSVSHQSDFV